jgi:hypothetical protein
LWHWHFGEKGTHYFVKVKNVVYRVDFAVMCRKGTVSVTCGDTPTLLARPLREHWLHFTAAQIDASPQECVEAIVAAATRLGGVAPEPITG